LVDALVENNALELLVQNLSRMDETDSDEAAAVFNTLSIIENMTEVKPAVAELVCERTKLLRWILNRMKLREFDSNKFYASEILAILLQSSEANQKRLGQLNGVDTLLQAVAFYKSRDPKTTEEEEMLENLFNSLCSVVMPMENKDRFVKAEGVELMIIIMKQKRLAYGSAMKALDFAMTRCPAACERFVDVLGLKTLFAAFMGKVLDQPSLLVEILC
jgi:beta-catenin-like protein 1